MMRRFTLPADASRPVRAILDPWANQLEKYSDAEAVKFLDARIRALICSPPPKSLDPFESALIICKLNIWAGETRFRLQVAA